jgi:hypothetical protein
MIAQHYRRFLVTGLPEDVLATTAVCPASGSDQRCPNNPEILLAGGASYRLATLSLCRRVLPAQQSLPQVADIKAERLANVLKREKVGFVLSDKPFLRLLVKRPFSLARCCNILLKASNSVLQNCQHQYLLRVKAKGPLISGKKLLRNENVRLKNSKRLFFRGGIGLSGALDPKRRPTLALIIRNLRFESFFRNHGKPPFYNKNQCSWRSRLRLTADG